MKPPAACRGRFFTRFYIMGSAFDRSALRAGAAGFTGESRF